MADKLTQKHSITVNGHRTSITLEGLFWESLKEIAAAKGQSVTALIAAVDATGPENLSAALRTYILSYYKTLIQNK